MKCVQETSKDVEIQMAEMSSICEYELCFMIMVFIQKRGKTDCKHLKFRDSNLWSLSKNL